MFALVLPLSPSCSPDDGTLADLPSSAWFVRLNIVWPADPVCGASNDPPATPLRTACPSLCHPSAVGTESRRAWEGPRPRAGSMGGGGRGRWVNAGGDILSRNRIQLSTPTAFAPPSSDTPVSPIFLRVCKHLLLLKGIRRKAALITT